MELGLSDKVALVCGASRGIAYAAAHELAVEGATLVICSRDASALADAAARLSATGAHVSSVVADLATTEGIATVVDHTMQHHGRADILITNTGGPPTGTALGHDWTVWQRASDMLLRSVVELTRAFVPGMRERRWGRVIGITSFAVKNPVPTLVLSNSLRAAVHGFLRTLADEVAVDGVTVNTVLPGYTETERLVDLANATMQRTGATREAIYDKWLADTPARRLGQPDELGAVIAFLASARAGFVTGQAICVDGGVTKSLL